jgi:hypothetical protein
MPNATIDMQTWKTDALSMYQRLLPTEFLHRLQSQTGIRQNNRVYNFLAVMWLMIAQRLGGGTSLQDAVLELRRGLPHTFRLCPCKRLQRQPQVPLSSHTGAYNRARHGLPLKVVEQSCDWIFEQLTAPPTAASPPRGGELSSSMAPRCGWLTANRSVRPIPRGPICRANRTGRCSECWWLTICGPGWPCGPNGDRCMALRR